MYLTLPPLKCSKCGSINSESYRCLDCYGQRCLDCGHETRETRNQAADPIVWTSGSTDLQEF